MAFRKGSKDVKKASFYVWFLGAKEAKGLRGDEFVLPVLHQLLDQERIIEPSKVTLQVSNKGLKIIQNVPKKSSSSGPVSYPSSSSTSASSGSTSSSQCKMEQIKHLIPHDSITCVVQEDDIVCCLLLIFNPVTKCPVHVHGYRCDSIETACALRESIQVLIDRPENQKKFAEIEKRLFQKNTSLPIHAHNHHHFLHPPSASHQVNATQHLQQELQQLPSPSGKELQVAFPHRTVSSSSSLTHRRSGEGFSSASDGRSTRTEGSDEMDDSPFPRGRSHTSASSQQYHHHHHNHNQHLHQQRMSRSGNLMPPSLVDRREKETSRVGGRKGDSFLIHLHNNNNHHLNGKSPQRRRRRVHSYHEDEVECFDDPSDVAFLVGEQDEEEKKEKFESLAQEFKIKLNAGPILLPPRDYDTISRGRGNLKNIESRKSTNKHIVGVLAELKAKKEQMKHPTSLEEKGVRHRLLTKLDMQSSHPTLSDVSSGKSSSGIGSDELLTSDPSKREDDNRKQLQQERNVRPLSESRYRSPQHQLVRDGSRDCHSSQSDDDLLDEEARVGPGINKGWPSSSRVTGLEDKILPSVKSSHSHHLMNSVEGRDGKLANKTSPSDVSGLKRGKLETPKYYFPDPSFNAVTSSSAFSTSSSYVFNSA